MNDVEEFIYQYENNQRIIMLFFHNLLTSDLNLTAKIRFKIPFYYGKSWICYLNPNKNNEKIELSFVRGNELSNHQGILVSKGRKQVYSIDISDLSEIHEGIHEVIHEAILLDDSLYKIKRKK